MLTTHEKAYANPIAVQLFSARVDVQTMSVLNGSVREKLLPVSWYANDDKGTEHPVVAWCWVRTDKDGASKLVFEGFVGPLDALRNMAADETDMNELMDCAAYDMSRDITEGWALSPALTTCLLGVK